MKKTSVGRPEWLARKTLEGIFYILDNGCKWRALPKEFENLKTVHGKFLKWCKNGTFDAIHKKVIERYTKTYSINWLAIDASHRKAPFAIWGGKNPTDRARNGIKVHLLVDWNGAPICSVFSASNWHDSRCFEQLLNKFHTWFPPTEPTIIAADSAYDAKKLRLTALQ